MKTQLTYDDLEHQALESLAINTIADAHAPDEHVRAARARLMRPRSDGKLPSGLTLAELRKIRETLAPIRDALQARDGKRYVVPASPDVEVPRATANET